MPEVRPATVDDLPAMGRALASAFADDPVWQWVTSPRSDWMERGAAWFSAECRDKLRGPHEVLVDDRVRGVAIWAPPDHWRSSTMEGLRLAVPSLRLFGSRITRGLKLVKRVEAEHPSTPHWYLGLLGTDPDHQGAGIGSALIEAVTQRCDEHGIGAYLESSKEQNVPYYARHGFTVSGEIHLPDGPPLWRMWRDPQG